MEVRDLLKANYTPHELEEKFLKGVPFAYLLGKVEFYGADFMITEDVLIPRPETEYLVDLILQNHKTKADRILDVGTGSGVILLSLLQQGLGEKGLGVDLSTEALKVAQRNAETLGLSEKTEFLLSDRLQKVSGTFELIVSNPPYIRENTHRHLVHDSVHTYEPQMALYLPDAKYDQWFEEFFLQIKEHLKGTFYMEGHELELEKQASLLKNLGFEMVQVLQDLTGAPRFLRARVR